MGISPPPALLVLAMGLSSVGYFHYKVYHACKPGCIAGAARPRSVTADAQSCLPHRKRAAGLSAATCRSRAGRTSMPGAMPFLQSKRRQVGSSEEISEIPYSGFYPRLHDQRLESLEALGDYFEAHVERGVRRIGEIRDLTGFQHFVRPCARRAGQLENPPALRRAAR